MSESFHFWLFFWIKLFLAFLNLHVILYYLLLVSVTFSKLFKLSNSLHAVQCLCFWVCKMTWLNNVASLTCFWFFKRSDQLTSFVFLSFFFLPFFTRILHFLQSNDRLFLNHSFFIVAFSFTTLIHNNVLNMKHMFFYICNCLSTLYQQLFKNCLFNDSIHLKKIIFK